MTAQEKIPARPQLVMTSDSCGVENDKQLRRDPAEVIVSDSRRIRLPVIGHCRTTPPSR